MTRKGKPRIMLVGPMPPTKGGVTTFMLNLIESPLNREFDFRPFTTSRPPKRNVTENWGYRAMLRGGLVRIATGAFITLWHAAKFPFALVKGRIDLVQIQASDYQAFWEAALYALMARMLRRPVLFRIGGAFDIFHGQASATEKQMIASVLGLPDVVIAQSSFARHYIRSAGRTGEIVQLPNWSRELNPREPVRLLTDCPVCLFITGLEARRKGIEEVLSAAEQLKTQGCAVRFHMVAVTPALMTRISASPVSDIVEMEGPVNHERVLELMRDYDIFLLPSAGEGFPNSLVEAMAAGMASIATPVGAVPEMAADGGVLIVAVGDAEALARVIAQLARSGALRGEIGARARQTVRSRYVASTALPNLAQAYRRLLEP